MTRLVGARRHDADLAATVGSRRFDVIVVGAGTAGCLVAGRHARAGATVLLVEAGADTPPNRVPADIADLYPRSYYNSDYMWPDLQARQLASDVQPSAYPQARVMGGGSSLMGMIALRGVPHNYERWAAEGAQGWDWPDVREAFDAIAHDRDLPGGVDGAPVSLRRHRPEDWPPLAGAVSAATARMGWDGVVDLNADGGDGFGALPLSATLSRRVSAASAYLDEETRTREGLVVACNTTVTRLLMTAGRCTGVELLVAGGRHRVEAPTTVVCGGAVHSPALLMRSGIGPERALARAGVRPTSVLEGVGGNLQNHPIVYLAAHLRHQGRQDTSLRPGFTTALRMSSELTGGSQGDLLMYVLNKSSWHGVGQATAGFGVSLMDPRSRGSVRITSADVDDPLEVNFGMLGRAEDLARLTRGFSVAAELMAAPEVRELRHECFVAGYSRVVRALNQPGIRNVAVTKTLASMLDGPRLLRRAMLRIGIAGRDLSERRLRDGAWLESTVAERSFGTYHPAGTCRMGRPEDPASVVDSLGAVLGVAGLYVADASIMPSVPSANTFLPTLMVAHRVTDGLVRVPQTTAKPGAAP